jgi:hypothetical protein
MDQPAEPALNWRDALVFILLLAALFGVYWSVLAFKYAYMDDYFWLDVSVKLPADVYGDQAVQGRPINGLILQWVFSHAGGIDGLWRVRALTLVEMAGMGWMFYWALFRCGWGRPAAGMVAGLACIVPPMQVYAAWATSVAIPLSGILACGAAIFAGWVQDHRRWKLLPLASLLVLASATIYQPTAMVFWPLAAADVLRQRRFDWRRFAIYLAVAALGLFLAFCVYKHGLAEFPTRRPSENRAGMTHEPIAKAIWFLQQPLMNALNLYCLRSTPIPAIVVGVFLIAGLLRYFQGQMRARLMFLLATAAIFPLAYIPNLLAKESWASYRTQIGMSWLTLVFAWMALQGLWPRQKLNWILIAALVWTMPLMAWQVMEFIVGPQAIELMVLRLEMAPATRPEIHHVIMLQPTSGSGFAPYSRYDEFGRTSMWATWVPLSAVNLIREEANPKAAPVTVELVPEFAGKWTKPLPPGTAVVDMRGVSRPEARP